MTRWVTTSWITGVAFVGEWGTSSNPNKGHDTNRDRGRVALDSRGGMPPGMPAPRCSPRSTPGMPAAVGSPDWRPPRCLPGPSSCPAREGSGNAATERTGTNRPAGGQGHRVTSQTRPSPHVRLGTHRPRPRRTRRQPPIPLTTCASSPPLGSPLWPLTRTATHLRHALRLTPCAHPRRHLRTTGTCLPARTTPHPRKASPDPPPHDGHLSPRANRASPPARTPAPLRTTGTCLPARTTPHPRKASPDPPPPDEHLSPGRTAPHLAA